MPVAPVGYASPYYGYIYGSSNRAADQPMTQENGEQKPMGFIPNPLDPAGNRQFPPPPPQMNGPPQFPTPIVPQMQADAQATTTTEAPAAKKSKRSAKFH